LHDVRAQAKLAARTITILGIGARLTVARYVM
jgi:hypothetical protein